MIPLLLLFWEFFKIGLFSIGGGLATLPFLYKLADRYDWFDYQKIGDMIAISESTPGPLGVNMATYTGFQGAGLLGGIVATAGLVTPSVIIIILISKMLKEFRNNPHVENVFYCLRPAVTGLIGAAGFGVIAGALFHVDALQNGGSVIGVKEMALFFGALVLTRKFNKIHPVAFIGLGAVVGIVFSF